MLRRKQGADYLEFRVGCHVAIRQGHKPSLFGQFVRITATTAVVFVPGDATVADAHRRFSRNSMFEIGTGLTKYHCAYICTVAEAVASDKKYAEAQDRARERNASTSVPEYTDLGSPQWFEHAGKSYELRYRQRVKDGESTVVKSVRPNGHHASVSELQAALRRVNRDYPSTVH